MNLLSKSQLSIDPGTRLFATRDALLLHGIAPIPDSTHDLASSHHVGMISGHLSNAKPPLQHCLGGPKNPADRKLWIALCAQLDFANS